ncbi:MAG: excinuclease ABC subunit UvrB [Phycisphaerales bacterium]
MPPRHFEIVSAFKPMGDQPAAIDALTSRLEGGADSAVLLGATGTGKTFTMANVVQRLGKPTLIISHNKTQAAQLYEELREFLPHNSVNYFVSYYDYYQPEAYIPQRDIYIEKDASRNEDLDQLRLAATSNILSRRDSVVVASVSCIFGLGSPEAYGDKVMTFSKGGRVDRRQLFASLTAMQYARSDYEFSRGRFRARGDVIEVWPASEKFGVRLDLFGDELERIELINPTSGEVLAEEDTFHLFPAVHYVLPEEQLESICDDISRELDSRVLELRSEGKLLEAQRLLARTKYDLDLLRETGTCPGVENYSRFFDGRMPGERPFTLLDYFDYAPRETENEASMRPRSASENQLVQRDDNRRASRPNIDDWLIIIDESHVTLPQVRAMFNGDRMRKETLVDHGFRLSSALDNRPMRFEEFERMAPQLLFVSATPGPYELERTGGEIAEQVIRPTGLLDPQVEVKPADGQVPDLLEECKSVVARGERVLVTALTKRLCEDLAAYLDQNGLKTRYLHSDIETLERLEIITDLREGAFDILVGVNLLREGLDLPEVSLVAILDADKEGFLRSPTSLIQLMGRAARNVNGRVVMYADDMTPAMKSAIDETERRREKQSAYNEKMGITPETVRKEIRRGIEMQLRARKTAREAAGTAEEAFDIGELLREIEAEMLEAAQKLEFEKAARLRDQARKLKERIAQGDTSKVRRSELDEGKQKKRQRRGKAGKPGTPGSKPTRRKKRTG